VRIDQAIQNRKVLITCGTGGVGKTTVSAAIALRAALMGKRVVVITIDPAKRLATSLGLKTLGDHPTDLTPLLRTAFDRAKAAGRKGLPQDFSGKLDAIVPDTRKTFETFVNELAPNPAVADRVMKNPIFQIFAKEFSGTNEYMALERLLALHLLGKYDLIVLDTPPSRNTLAFLHAPQLLARFFEERLIRWLVLPANKFMASGMRKALGILEKLTGAGFMTNLFDFASALFEVQASFAANLNRVIALLESDQVGFLMVTTPAPDVVPEIRRFIHSLKEHRFHFDGVALNRTLGYLERDDNLNDTLQRPEWKEAFAVVQALQAREKSVLEAVLKDQISVCAKLPELARDVHSVEDLFHVAMALDSDIT
jgi:anion-transporting  ArsA/GET3 family ATPase